MTEKKGLGRFNLRKSDKPVKTDTTNASSGGSGGPDKPQKPKKRKLRVLRTIVFVILGLILVSCLAVGIWVLTIAVQLPEITAEDLISAQTSFLYDSEGNEFAALHGAENRITVELDEMPYYLIDAVIATEDERFYEHGGIDLRSIMRAVVIDVADTIKNKEVTFTQGASTITMQLMRNVIEETDKNMTRKVKEALLAMKFEKHYDKDEILYYYLNEIYIGPNTYGMQAAAQYYFGKDVADISISEAALLAGLLRNPGYYSPYSNPDGALTLRNTVLNNLIKYDEEKYGEIAEAAKADELIVVESTNSSADYDHPWFVDTVIDECSDILTEMDLPAGYVYSGGLHIYTTIDTDVQEAMESAYANDANFPPSSTGDVVESGMVIVDPKTGAVRGIMGGRSYDVKRGFNRGKDLVRSSGSTIKPIAVYAPAVDLGYGAGYVINDTKIAGSYSPNNSDHAFRGRISMRRAIMGSRNICAVKLLNIIGPDVGWSYAVDMGLPLVSQDANPALALGGLTYGVSPLNMAGAFATLANKGIYTEPYCIEKITDARGEVIYSVEPESKEVISEGAAYIVTDMLISAVNGGTGTNARLSGWQVAGKTGTNELPSEDPDYRGKSGTKDAWFVGYTPVLTGAVWMGYDNKFDDAGNLQYLRNIYGGSYPARLWRSVMTEALANYEKETFSRPSSVVSVTIDTKSGMLPSDLTPSEYIGTELYLSGHAPSQVSDIWGVVNVCNVSGLLAGRGCYSTSSAVKIVDMEGYYSGAADAGLYAPQSTCTQCHGYDPSITPDPGVDPSDDPNQNPDQEPEVNTPSEVSVSLSNGSSHVSWVGNNSSTNVQYTVERTTNGSRGKGKTTFTVYGNILVDTSVESGKSYTYRVRASNAVTGDISGWSGSASVNIN